jgi:hypothetical protein
MDERDACGERQAAEAEVVHIRPMAFVRSMLAIAWCCIRHPFSPTMVAVVQGKVVQDPIKT